MASGQSRSRRSFSTAHCLMLVMLPLLMDACITTNARPNETSLDLPHIVSDCLTPMDLSTSIRWREELIYGKRLKNVSMFCEEGGMMCDENLETPFVTLYQLSTYRLSKFDTYKSGKLKEANIQKQNIFFQESELYVGNFMKLPMEEPLIPTRAFLPVMLEPFLFNSSRSIFSHMLLPFGFKDGSPLANSMQETLELCKASPMEGETKACMATFEDMFDFATSLMASSDVSILAAKTLPSQKLAKVVAVDEMTNEGQSVAVACHNAMFPFQVFYCHHIKGTKVFNVTLQTTANNDIILAIATCHPLMEASLEEIEAILHIKVKENGLLCHWNHGDNIVWVPRRNMLSQWKSGSLSTSSSKS